MEMDRKDKVLFTIFVIVTQVLQFLAVYSIVWLNNRVIEFLFIFLSFQANRVVFGKSYHADQLSKCTLLTLVIFYFLTRGVIPLNISIFCAPLFGVYLSYVLNYAHELISHQVLPKPFDKMNLREQVRAIMGCHLEEDDFDKACKELGLKSIISETVYLYMTNTKDEVSDILDIEGSTVIRRTKKFVNTAREKNYSI